MKNSSGPSYGGQFWLPLIAALGLGGCGTYITVRHVNAPGNLQVQDVSRLERTVVVMKLAPPRRPAGVLGKAVQNLAESSSHDEDAAFPLPRLEALDLLEATAATLRSPVSQVMAYLIHNPSTTNFLDALNATAVLWLSPSLLSASQTKQEVKHYDKKSGKPVVRELYARSSEFIMDYRLESWPERRLLAQRKFSQPFGDRSPDQRHLKRWLLEHTDMRRTWLPGLGSDLLPITTIRRRLLQKKGQPAALKAGSRHARRGEWEQAREQWDTALRSGDHFRLHWNLGLYHERNGQWQEAREAYQRARHGAEKSKDRRTLGRYLAELGQLYTLPPAAGPADSEAWFDEPLAVMPFANNSNDVGAPERIRAKVQEELKRKRYAVLPLEAVTQRMRELGVTDGAHLKAFPPDKIAEAAQSRHILAGTVLEFKTVNVGLYRLHHVHLRLRLQDELGRILWESTGHGYREILVSPKDAGKAFFGGLIESAFTKATRQHLNEEINGAVLTGLESLPTKPGSARR